MCSRIGFVWAASLGFACGTADPPSPGVSSGSASTDELFCQDLPDVGALFTEQLELTDASGATKVVLIRSVSHPGSGKSWWYELHGMAVQHPTTGVVCESDPERLEYENSHHNWADAAILDRSPIRYVYRQTYQWSTPTQPDSGWELSVEALANDHSSVWGPVSLSLADCLSVGQYDYHGCPLGSTLME